MASREGRRGHGPLPPEGGSHTRKIRKRFSAAIAQALAAPSTVLLTCGALGHSRPRFESWPPTA